jgi:hypothetical protein
MQKTVFRLSLVISVLGLILSIGETYRKSNHQNKVLAEMAIVIEDVKNTPKTTPVYDADGVPVQSEAEVKALTDALKMDCMTKVVNSDWKIPTMCEPLITTILADPFDRKDLSFRPKRHVVLAGILMALAPFYFLVLRGLVRRLPRRKLKKT